MLAALSSGKMNTFALPATGLPGALRSPTEGTYAASNCSSPSGGSSGAFWCASAVASRTLVTMSCSAEPLVLKDSIATAGSMPVSVLYVFAVAIATSASWSTGRVRDDGAVAKAQQLAVGHHHEKHGADRLAARCSAENLQGRPQHVAGAVDRARDQCVCYAGLQHAGGKVAGIHGKLSPFLGRHTLGLALLIDEGGKLGCLG